MPLLWVAAACGPSPIYSRFDGTGGSRIDGGVGGAGSGGAEALDGGGVYAGGGGAGGFGSGAGSGGVAAAGGALGSSGGNVGSGGVRVGGSGGLVPGSGGSPVGSGGANPGTGGVGGRGGSPVATGGANLGGAVGTGGTPGTGGMGSGGSGTGGAAGAPDLSNYGFESSVQTWGMAGGSPSWTTIGRSTAVSFAGAGSLAATVSAEPDLVYILEVAPPSPAIPAGSTVTFHVRLPTAAVLTSVQPYVMETGTYRFTGTLVSGAALAKNAWIKIDVKVPSDAASILRLGVQFTSSGTWSGTVYLDAIDW